MLGIFPTVRWPVQDAGHLNQVRADVMALLLEQAPLQARTAGLIGLLQAIRAVHLVASAVRPETSFRELTDLRRRAHQIAEADWASPAVRATLKATHTVVQDARRRPRMSGGGGIGSTGGGGM